MGPLAILVGGFGFWRTRSVRATQASSSPPSGGSHTLLAARAAAEGDLGLARQEITAALAETPDHASALLVLACISLEAGALQEAREVIFRLRTLAPAQPEPWLLQKLLENRQRASPLGWGQAFLDAWTGLGRPDLQGSRLLPETVLVTPEDPVLEEAWSRASSSRARFTLALVLPTLSEERARWGLQQVPVLDDSALLVGAFDMLSDKRLPASLRQEAAPVLRQRLAQLAETAPQAMWLRLFHLMAGTEGETPLGPRELDALESISVLPTWRDDAFMRTFLEARHRLQELAVPNSRGAAFLVAERTLGHRGALLLLKRAAATREQLAEDVRRRLGRMLWRMGSRLSEQSSLLETTVGALLMASGATSMRHGGDQRAAFAREDEVHAAVMTSLRAALDRWPLHSLQEELLQSRARSEVTWLRAFAGRASLP